MISYYLVGRERELRLSVKMYVRWYCRGHSISSLLSARIQFSCGIQEVSTNVGLTRGYMFK